MVKGVEDLRTPLREIIDLDKKLRGTLSGFMMPAFVVDLPGGGGKRLVSTYETFDEVNGFATYRAPGLDGDKGTRTYTYYDPKPVDAAELATLRQQKAQALESGQTLGDFMQSTFFDPSHQPTQLSMPAISQDAGSACTDDRVSAGQPYTVSPTSLDLGRRHTKKGTDTQTRRPSLWPQGIEVDHASSYGGQLAASA